MTGWDGKYSKYLRSKHWQATRLWALERAEGSCQLCEGREGLQVHHRSYERLCAERPADLVVLCGDCHKKHHEDPAQIGEWDLVVPASVRAFIKGGRDGEDGSLVISRPGSEWLRAHA